MFQTSIVPREAVEFYGEDFGRNPVGTGPFILDTWVPKQSLTLNRNPNYHEVLYPARDEWSREDMRNRLHRDAGRQVPFVDRIEFSMFVQDQPMWLQFNLGSLGYTEVPEAFFTQAFDRRTKALKPELASDGVRAHSNKLLDFIFRGFNMEDEDYGGYTEDRRKVRQAISLAVDWNEFNEAFYNGLLTIYDGPIPPGLDGHPENGRSDAAYRGPDLARSRQLLEEAGHPGGRGLPPLRFYTSTSSLNQQMAEMLRRQLGEIGIELETNLVDFSQLIEFVNNRKAPLFGFAWSSDYPDAENNLALFYGPNEAPGSNHYNYKRPEYDALYEQILTMQPGPERTAIYEQMRDMILQDVPYLGSKARERFYLIAPWLRNAKPTERYYGWFKYLDVDPELMDSQG
jgi:ABC-type transport system substrate-binding protein